MCDGDGEMIAIPLDSKKPTKKKSVQYTSISMAAIYTLHFSLAPAKYNLPSLPLPLPVILKPKRAPC